MTGEEFLRACAELILEAKKTEHQAEEVARAKQRILEEANRLGLYPDLIASVLIDVFVSDMDPVILEILKKLARSLHRELSAPPLSAEARALVERIKSREVQVIVGAPPERQRPSMGEVTQLDCCLCRAKVIVCSDNLPKIRELNLHPVCVRCLALHLPAPTSESQLKGLVAGQPMSVREGVAVAEAMIKNATGTPGKGDA